MTERRTTPVAVSAVTLLEDRAVVRRRGRISLSEGRNRIRIEGVSPVLVDKSLLGELAADARLVDVRVCRERVAVHDVARGDAGRIDDEIREAKAALERVSDRARARRSELDGVGQLLQRLAQDLSVDAAWGRAITADRSAAFDRLVERDKALRVELAEVTREMEERKLELSRKVEKRRIHDHPSTKSTASLDVDIDSPTACEGELTLSYVVPNACWRPRHRATLGAEGELVFQSEAVVWQNTGEAWTSVALSFSTERPSLGAEPPTLTGDPLGLVRKGALVVETREEEVQRAGLGAAEKRTVEELPGIDDGGHAVSLQAEHEVTITSDGRPHGVPISTFTTTASVDMVSMPELARAAVTKATFENGSGKPLLPGPVELVRHGGPVGRTTIEYIAPAEKLALGFGPDGAVRIHREIEPLKDESSMLSAWTTTSHDVRIRLSNLGPYPKSILVQERVPISEIEKLQISVVAQETTGGKQPDENGFVSWRIELPPLGRSEIKLRVVKRRHSDVVGA